MTIKMQLPQGKQYLAEALVHLLERKSIEEISITELTQKAGVSRMTYYRNYQSKINILEDYLDAIIQEFHARSKKTSSKTPLDYESIRESFRLVEKYKEFAKCLTKQNLTGILQNAINRYVDNELANSAKDFPEKCKMYYYAGALYNVYVQWIKNDMKEDINILSQTVYGCLPHTKSAPILG